MKETFSGQERRAGPFLYLPTPAASPLNQRGKESSEVVLMNVCDDVDEDRVQIT